MLVLITHLVTRKYNDFDEKIYLLIRVIFFQFNIRHCTIRWFSSKVGVDIDQSPHQKKNITISDEKIYLSIRVIFFRFKKENIYIRSTIIFMVYPLGLELIFFLV